MIRSADIWSPAVLVGLETAKGSRHAGGAEGSDVPVEVLPQGVRQSAEKARAEAQKAKAKWTQLEALIGSEDRIQQIARDIVIHFEQRQEVFEGKGMTVTMSRRIASDLFDEIIKIKPQWHIDELQKGVLKVVMTSSSSDGPKMAKHHTTKEQRRALAERMKDTDVNWADLVRRYLKSQINITEAYAFLNKIKPVT